MTLCSYHVTFAFQSKSTLNSCLSVKEHLAWPVRLNGWVFVYGLSGFGFESSYSHLYFMNARNPKCFLNLSNSQTVNSIVSHGILRPAFINLKERFFQHLLLSQLPSIAWILTY